MEEFEELVCGYVGKSFGIAVSSGTAGLHLCIGAMGIGPGDEVIVPDVTFIATANAVTLTGAKPILARQSPTRADRQLHLQDGAISGVAR